MQIPWELIVSFGIGLALLALVGYLLLVPMRLLRTPLRRRSGIQCERSNYQRKN